MFRSPIRTLVVALAVTGLAGCRDAPPKSPKMAEVLPNVPLPPNSTFISKSGGSDALQITLRSTAEVDAVAAYYRQVFKGNGWHLVNEAKDQDGAVVLFAEQRGPPLWVRIRKAEDGRGTLVDLAGARLLHSDSVSVAPTPGPKPTF